MLRRSLDVDDRLGDRSDLVLLTELLLGAVTEAAQQVAPAPARTRTKAARLYGAQLRTMIASVVEPGS